MKLIPEIVTAGPRPEIHYVQERGWDMPWTIRRIERRVSPERRRGLNDASGEPSGSLNRRRTERRASATVVMTDSPPVEGGGWVGTVRLTKREREIKELIAAGLGNKEIARRLNIATNTVKSHVHNMLGKLAALMPADRRLGRRRRRRNSRRSYRFTR